LTGVDDGILGFAARGAETSPCGPLPSASRHRLFHAARESAGTGGPSQFHHHVGPVQLELLRPRLLEAEGWLTRHYEPTVPPQVTYAITKRVLVLDGVRTELDRIAERWYGKSGKRT
jgi:DNA-binding HxlR family transcriptional regulator